jgi:hypothetical protein
MVNGGSYGAAIAMDSNMRLNRVPVEGFRHSRAELFRNR